MSCFKEWYEEALGNAPDNFECEIYLLYLTKTRVFKDYDHFIKYSPFFCSAVSSHSRSARSSNSDLSTHPLKLTLFSVKSILRSLEDKFCNSSALSKFSIFGYLGGVLVSIFSST